MKWRFEWAYRLGLALLFVIAFWAVWATAQETTNATTNANAPAASQLLKIKLPEHALTFGLDQIDFLRDQTLLEQPLWTYLASLIYVALAFCVAWLLDWFVTVWLKKLAAKKGSKYDDLILELLRGPVKVVAFVILLNIGLGIFEWPERAQAYISRGFILVVAGSVAYVALKVVDLLLGIWHEKIVSPQDRAFAEQLLPFISKVAKTVVIISAVVLTADNMLENGADIRFIQQLLGHEKLDTTAIYTEVSIKQLQEVHARCHPSARPENEASIPAANQAA